ncbi:MAG: HlyD family type I secretion periplasmic adaptor subunit [Pseudomonadota bacterium]
MSVTLNSTGAKTTAGKTGAAPAPQMQAQTWSTKGPIRLGLLAIVILIGGFGTWAVGSNIAGAIVATGVIEVDQNRQAIQHRDGGVVADLMVEDGAMVAAGDVVLRLEGAEMASELSVIRAQLDEVRARRARLEAERDGLAVLRFDTGLVDRAAGDDSLNDILRGQANLFAARAETMAREIDQLSRQSEQIEDEIGGLEAQRTALTRQRELLTQDLEAQQSLMERGLTQSTRVLTLQREEAAIAGSIGEIAAQIAQASVRLSEIDLAVLQIETARREQAIAELREVRVQEETMAEQERELTRRMNRMDLRAPVSGVVYGLTVFGAQSVVRPAEPIMFLIPQNRPLVIAARIEAIHVDQVFPGQAAALRFPAFDTRTTPELAGRVTRISADAFIDETTGESFYDVELILEDGETDRIPDLTFLPGMPVEAFIRTEDRTPMQYLVRPLTDYFNRAFRES